MLLNFSNKSEQKKNFWNCKKLKEKIYIWFFRKNSILQFFILNKLIDWLFFFLDFNIWKLVWKIIFSKIFGEIESEVKTGFQAIRIDLINVQRFLFYSFFFSNSLETNKYWLDLKKKRNWNFLCNKFWNWVFKKV